MVNVGGGGTITLYGTSVYLDMGGTPWLQPSSGVTAFTGSISTRGFAFDGTGNGPFLNQFLGMGSSTAQVFVFQTANFTGCY